MAGAVCCSWRYREVLTAATGRKQTLRKREGRPGGTFEEPCSAPGGAGAESLQGGRREGGHQGERAQDAAGCKSDRAVRESKDIMSLEL